MPLMSTIAKAASVIPLRPPTDTMNEEMQARNALPMVKIGGALDSLSWGIRTLVFTGNATPEEVCPGTNFTLSQAFDGIEAWFQAQQTPKKTVVEDGATKSMVAALTQVWTQAKERASKSSSPNFVHGVAKTEVDLPS